MSTKNLFSRVVMLIAIVAAMVYNGIAQGAENVKESLDVNLNPVQLSGRALQNRNFQGEFVIQIPFAITDQANKTGLGPVGAAYFDHKTFSRIGSDGVATRGLGRLYYVYASPDMITTIVPYVTLYRDHAMDFELSGFGNKRQIKTRSWLPPGFMLARRVNDDAVLHLDGEIYSNARIRNNLFRTGVSYRLSEKWFDHNWTISGSYERLAWDVREDGNSAQVFMKGSSNKIYTKLISSRPKSHNFAFVFGFSADKNAEGAGLLQKGANNSEGIFIGFEASLNSGTLVW